MAGLLEKPTTDTAPEAAATPEAPAPAPAPEAPARTCATCSAGLVEGQDWCLECGSAQPGRLGGRPGWRAALTVLAVTALLVGGAGAAAYAALTTEAQRDATAAAPPAATPTVAAPPPVQAPAPTQAEETPTVQAPESDPADVPAPSDSSDDDTPAVTPTPSDGTSGTTGTSGSGTSGTGTGGDTTSDDAAAEPVAIDLPAKAAKLYDPFGRAANAGSKPANAVDGKQSTAFELPVDPAEGTVRAGLLLSLDEAKTLGDLEFTAGTPGFTVEVYATRSKELPPDVLDSRWEHVGDRRDVGVEETVELGGTFRHVLLWITEQPADTKVALTEVQLYD